MGAATAAIVSTALSIGSSIYSAKEQKKAQRSAEARAREAAKRNVTVQASSAEPTRVEAETAEGADIARQNARKRRQGLSSTVNSYLTSSLLGNKNIFGG